MNTNQELERIVRDWLDDRAVDPPPSSLAGALRRVATTPQRRRGWLGRWIGHEIGATRSAGDRGWPSDTQPRRDRLMFGFASVAASVGALALVATLIVPGGEPGPRVLPGAESGTSHVVAADGSGDFTTIGEALAAAADGDSILVRPGEYAEALVIDKDITLRGEGPRAGILVTFPQDEPVWTADDGTPIRATMRLEDSNATIEGLSVASTSPAQDAGAIAVLAVGGAPQLRDLSIVSEGAAEEMGFSFVFSEGSRPVLRDSSWSGYVYSFLGAAPTIEGNTITAEIVSLNGPGEVTVRNNTFIDGAGISASERLTGLIEANDFTGGGIAIDTQSQMTIRDNVLRDVHRLGQRGLAAILVSDPGSSAAILDNSVTGSDCGIMVVMGSQATVEGNDVRESQIGIATGSDGAVLTGNVIESNEVGLSLTAHARPTLSGNTFCGNGKDLLVLGEGNPTTLDGNEVCQEAAS